MRVSPEDPEPHQEALCPSARRDHQSYSSICAHQNREYTLLFKRRCLKRVVQDRLITAALC